MSRVVKKKSKLQPTIRFFNTNKRSKMTGPMSREEQKVAKIT